MTETHKITLEITKHKQEPGLYLVATPIGNMRDITLRALDILCSCDLILCEDTRVTGKLLQNYVIDKPMMPYHDHSTGKIRDKVIREIQSGKAVALVSDAGMPLISDPGYKLVTACRDEGIYVTTCPGANAVLSGLQLSGLPSDKFLFLGFPPNKSGARVNFLSKYKGLDASLVLYEGASRIEKTLTDIQTVFGDVQAAVIREITKKFEQTRSGPVSKLITHYSENGADKGEFVIVIAPPSSGMETLSPEELDQKILDYLQEHRVKDTAKLIAEETGLPKKQIYDRAVELSKDN